MDDDYCPPSKMDDDYEEPKHTVPASSFRTNWDTLSSLNELEIPERNLVRRVIKHIAHDSVSDKRRGRARFRASDYARTVYDHPRLRDLWKAGEVTRARSLYILQRFVIEKRSQIIAKQRKSLDDGVEDDDESPERPLSPAQPAVKLQLGRLRRNASTMPAAVASSQTPIKGQGLDTPDTTPKGDMLVQLLPKGRLALTIRTVTVDLKYAVSSHNYTSFEEITFEQLFPFACVQLALPKGPYSMISPAVGERPAAVLSTDVHCWAYLNAQWAAEWGVLVVWVCAPEGESSLL